MTSPRLQGQHFLEIHEFSTGIYADGNYDDWISRGFTGAYMNATIDPIPNIIEIAIANGLFQAVGGLPHQPAIIGRVLQGKNEQWSVVAVVTIGKDGEGRSLSVFRYFLAEGTDKISAIVAWIEDKRKQGKLPIFNPFETKRLGGFHKVNVEIPEPIQLREEDLNWLNESVSSVTKATPQPSLQDIDDLAYAKSRLNNKPISWAYNIYSLQQPNRFQVIHPVNDASRLAIQQQIQIFTIPDPQMDINSSAKRVLRSLISTSELRSEQIEEFLLLLTNPNVEWQNIFNNLGAIDAINHKVYAPNLIRLIVWQAIAVPQTTMIVLDWLLVDDKRQRQQNQQIFFNLQWQLRPYMDDIRANLILGIVESIISLYSKPEKKYINSSQWLLKSKDSLWASLNKEVITSFIDRVLPSARDNQDASQAWQDFIQTSNSTAVNNTLLEEPKDWQVFYDGIRDYVTTKQNNKQYHYVAEFFEQLASGKKKNFLNGLPEFASGFGQVIIFIAAIIFVIIFNNFFAANIAKEISLSVSMFLPLTWLVIVSLITQSFMATWGLGILHIILSKFQLCLTNSQGIAVTFFWSIAILIIGLYASRSSSNKNGNVNRDAYALAAVFYTISDGTVSQDVFAKAKSRSIQGISISSTRTIDHFLIGFGKGLIKAMQKAWQKNKLLPIAIVVFVLAIGLVADKVLEAIKLPNLSGLISYSNPNCFDPVPRGNWATTRAEIKRIVDERVSAGNRPSLVITELLNVLGVTEQGAFPGKGGYSYATTIDNQGTNQIMIQRWQDRIREYQTNKRQQYQDIVVSGYLTSGDRTSQLLRADLVARLTPQPTPTPSATPSPRPSATPSPNGNVTINQAEIQRMFDEIQQTIDGTSRSAERPAIATQQRILQAIQTEVPPPPPNATQEPLRFPLVTPQDEITWKYDIKRTITGDPYKDPTPQQWQDFKNRVIQRVRN